MAWDDMEQIGALFESQEYVFHMKILPDRRSKEPPLPVLSPVRNPKGFQRLRSQVIGAFNIATAHRALLLGIVKGNVLRDRCSMFRKSTLYGQARRSLAMQVARLTEARRYWNL